MADSTHLLIPFAAPGSPASRAVLRELPLPNLDKLLSRLTVTDTDVGDARSLTPPHERALAQAWGMAAGDGKLPWAALQAREEGRAALDQPWARITPCHWRMGSDHIDMLHPHDLELDTSESQALLASMQPFFAQDGITLVYNAPTLWLAHGEVFRDLATASLDRVIGRSVDPWLPQGPRAPLMRRLQSEMQMLLYTHPVNESRERGGQLTVNSFWLSSTGFLPPETGPAPRSMSVMHYLRDTALLGDWTAWAEAWKQFDVGTCARLLKALEAGKRVTLTLCGEHSAQTWDTRPRSLFRQISSRLSRQPAYTLLEAL